MAERSAETHLAEEELRCLDWALQALKAQFEREISTNEEKGEEKRRTLSKQVRGEGRRRRGDGGDACCCSDQKVAIAISNK
jgi:hypothetical protein